MQLNARRAARFLAFAITTIALIFTAQRWQHTPQAPQPRAIKIKAAALTKPQLDLALVGAVKKRDVAQVKSLLARRADANARDDSARAAWRKLSARNFQESSPKPAPFVGPTLVMIAAHNADNATLSALLDAGAKVELRGVDFGASSAAQEGESNIDLESHVTPLMEAMMSGKPGTMRLLLDRGADVNARDGEGLTALDWAHNMTPTSQPTPEHQKFLDRIFKVLEDARARRSHELDNPDNGARRATPDSAAQDGF